MKNKDIIYEAIGIKEIFIFVRIIFDSCRILFGRQGMAYSPAFFSYSFYWGRFSAIVCNLFYRWPSDNSDEWEFRWQ